MSTNHASSITFVDFIKGFGGMISSAIASMVGGYVVLPSQQKHDDEIAIRETDRTESTQGLNHYRELMKLQREYSECIRLMYDFQRQYPTNYGEEFTRQLESRTTGPYDPENFDPISAVNRCRSITVNYWREVFAFIHSYPKFTEQNDLLNSWKYKHGRFVELVQPLDQLSDYTDEEKMAVYNRNLFERVNNKD